MILNWQNKLNTEDMPEDKRLQNFLFQSGSLSRSIEDNCTGSFNVELKNESWSTPMPEEAELLKLEINEITFVRESWLKCDDKKLVYARTVIPRLTYENASHELTELGNKPLGNILFNDDSTYRSNMQYAKIPSDCTLYKQATTGTDSIFDLWGRQSLFYIDKNPLLITEVFLPTILECSKN